MTRVAKNFYVANFGCRASQSEGAAIQEELIDANAEAAASPYQASVVIVNSCTVTAEADREVRQMIRRVSSRNPEAQIIVTGCYAQRAPEELADSPGVRYVVGNSHKPLIGNLALEIFEEEFSSQGRAEILCSSIFLERELKPAAHQGSGGRTRAIVKVQDGCNANCSFCVIPSVRGRSRSLQPESVLTEVVELVQRGYKEVVFSGIHLGTYGRDLPSKTSLFELVAKTLEQNSNLESLRLSSIEPMEVTPDIVDVVARHPRVAHHLHVPLQSGSTRILREMRRPYTPGAYASLIEGIRREIPDASIGADVMVGFPGETDDEFMETYNFISGLPLTYLHVFPYSSRPGTVAADMPHHVPGHVSHFRGKALRQLIAQKNEAFRRTLVGGSLRVLALEPGKALSHNFLQVQVPMDVPLNEWVDMPITDLTPDGLRS